MRTNEPRRAALNRGLLLCTAGLLACLALQAADGKPAGWRQAMASGEQALAAQDYEAAEDYFQQALDAAEASAAGPETVEALVRLARVYRRQGDFAKPEGLYRRALSAAEEVYGAKTADYARVLNETGRYYHTRRKYTQAGEYYRKAFALRVRALGREHPEVAGSINNLAVLFENQGRHDKAAVYYETALKIRKETLGPQHPETVVTMEHFARLLRKMQRVAEAEKLEAVTRPLRTQWVREMSGEPVALDVVTDAGPRVKPPELKQEIEPRYTQEARIARHEGRVLLEADISAGGTVHNIRLVESLGLGLDERAVEAARQWRFRPARKDGDKVAMRATLEINFRLL